MAMDFWYISNSGVKSQGISDVILFAKTSSALYSDLHTFLVMLW